MFKYITVLILASALVIITATETPALVGNETTQAWQTLYATGKELLNKHRTRDAEYALQAALGTTRGDIRKEILTLLLLDQVYEEEENYPAQERTLLRSVRLLRSSRQFPNNLLGGRDTETQGRDAETHKKRHQSHSMTACGRGSNPERS